MADTISISTPVDYQIFQRDGSDQADLGISGTYTGTAPTSVEVQWSGGGWTTLDAAPAGGTFSGVLSAQSAGQGLLEVRDGGIPAVTDSAAYVGIGDVIVVAGQSNASGRGNLSQSYSHATLKAGMFRQDDAWAELSDPTDGTDLLLRGGSAWPLMATLIMAETGFPVAFVTTADGGTGLVSPANWTKPGAQYTDCVETVTNSGINSALCILWHQGEEDAVNGVSTAQYQAALSAMLDNLQADVAALAGVKLITCSIGEVSSATSANLDSIRIAQTEIPATDSDILSGPPLHDVGPLSDGVHFKTSAQLLILAQRWWHYVHLHLLAGTEGRAPYYSTAAVTGPAEIEITFTIANTPLINADVTGWAVRDGAGDLAVTNCAVAGGVATLTLARAVAGNTYVSFGSGDDGIGTTIRDSSTYGLPPEPFTESFVANVTTGAGDDRRRRR